MKISELVEKLEDIRAKEGDMEIVIEDAPKNFEQPRIGLFDGLGERCLVIGSTSRKEPKCSI